MNEYEVVALVDTQDTCVGCIFNHTTDSGNTTCLNNMTISNGDEGIDVWSGFMPDCTEPEGSSSDYSIIYRLAHRISGHVLEPEEIINLVNHYKGSSSE